ncbi:MAG: AmmeMemoRadiSam system protein B [Thermodesulfobacteriota bacterium]
MKLRSQVFAFVAALVAVLFPLRPALAGAQEPVREPAVAGQFYSADAKELSAEVESLLAAAKRKALPGRLRGLVVPHAGYRFSGPVAASAYVEVPRDITKVLLLGISHYSRYAGACVSPAASWETPLGRVPVSPDAALLRKIPGFSLASCPDEREHSLEVQLPFLQKRLARFTLLPVMISEAEPVALAEGLAPFIDDNTLVVASSDLSHYYSYERAAALDAICAEAVPNLDFTKIGRCQACGIIPVTALMEIARARGWKGVLLDLRNSADTAGPMRQVVGYMAVAFVDTAPAVAPATPRPPPAGKIAPSCKPGAQGATMQSSYSQKDISALLALARSAIRAKLVKGATVTRPENPSPALSEKRGCFVTLHKDGDLRGCIGTIEPVMSLVEAVEQNAVHAAFRDPRFAPLSADELPRVDIEISVLTVPEPLPHDGPDDLLKKLTPGKDGIILSRGGRRATFLPQVWEQLPNPEVFLINLCRKAGFTPNCWRDPDVLVERYRVEYFGERDPSDP